MSLNRYQRAKLNEQVLDETLFNDSYKSRSRIILEAETLEDPEVENLFDAGICVPQNEDHFATELIYNIGSKSNHYFLNF